MAPDRVQGLPVMGTDPVDALKLGEAAYAALVGKMALTLQLKPHFLPPKPER